MPVVCRKTVEKVFWLCKQPDWPRLYCTGHPPAYFRNAVQHCGGSCVEMNKLDILRTSVLAPYIINSHMLMCETRYFAFICKGR